MKRLLLITALISVSLFEATATGAVISSAKEQINGIYKIQLKDKVNSKIIDLGKVYITEDEIAAIKNAGTQDQAIHIISKAMDIADYFVLSEEEKAKFKASKENYALANKIQSLRSKGLLSDNDYQKLLKALDITSEDMALKSSPSLSTKIPNEILAKILEFNAGVKMNSKLEDKFDPRKSDMRYVLDLKGLEVKKIGEDKIITIPCTAKRVEFKVIDCVFEVSYGRYAKMVSVQSNMLDYVLKTKIELPTPQNPDTPSIDVAKGYYSNEELCDILGNRYIRSTIIDNVEILFLQDELFENLLRIIERAKLLAINIGVDISIAVDLLTKLPFLRSFNENPKLVIKKHDQEYSLDFRYDHLDQPSYPVLSIYFTAEKADKWYKSVDKQVFDFFAITDENLKLPESTLIRIKVGDKEFRFPGGRAFQKEDVQPIYSAFSNYTSNLRGDIRLPVQLYDAINLDEAFGPLFAPAA